LFKPWTDFVPWALTHLERKEIMRKILFLDGTIFVMTSKWPGHSIAGGMLSKAETALFGSRNVVPVFSSQVFRHREKTRV